MAEHKLVTRTTPPRTVTQDTIQWGTIIKGAAVIATVALVAVVGFSLASGVVGGFVAGNPAIAGFFGGAIEAIAQVGGLLWSGLSFVGGAIANGFTALFPSIANAGSAAALTAGSEVAAGSAAGTVGTTIGTAAGIGVAGAAAWFGLPAIKNAFSKPLMAPETVHIAGRTEVIQHTGHDENIAARREAEKAIQDPEFTNHAVDHGASTPTNRSSASWAERTATPARQEVTPRSASHSAQIVEDRANPALAEATR